MNIEHLQSHEGAQFPTTKEMRTRAFDLLAKLPFDTLVTYQQFADVLGLNPVASHRARGAVLKAGRDLLKEHNKKIVNVKNDGYRIIRPNEHRGVSQSQQRGARRKLRDALQTVTHVALDNLTPKEVAEVMLEQARAAIQLSMTKQFSRVKDLPPRQDLHLPSSAKLVDMMRKKHA
jgi:alkylated DNA nucleotide flippase Atl1